MLKYLSINTYNFCQYCSRIIIIADLLLFLLQLHSGDSSNFDIDFTSQPAKVTVVAPHLVEAIDQEVFEGFTSSTSASTNNSSTRV